MRCRIGHHLQYNTNSAQASSARFLPDGWAALAARYGHAYTAVGGWRDNYPQTITSKYPIETLLKITDSDQAGKPVSHGAAIQRVTVKGRTINIVIAQQRPQAHGFRWLKPRSGGEAAMGTANSRSSTSARRPSTIPRTLPVRIG